jgi:hypothetical protein
MTVDGYTPVYFNVGATLVVDSRYIAADVSASATAALEDAFSFENRDFGQRVAASEVISVLQRVPGVIAVTLDSLAYAPRPATGISASLSVSSGFARSLPIATLTTAAIAATPVDVALPCVGASSGIIGPCASVIDGVLIAKSATWRRLDNTIQKAELLMINTQPGGINLNTTQEQQ